MADNGSCCIWLSETFTTKEVFHSCLEHRCPSFSPSFNCSFLFPCPPQLSAVPCLCPPVHTRLILAWCPTQDWTGSWPAQEDSVGRSRSPRRSARQPAPTPAAPWWAVADARLSARLWFIVQIQPSDCHRTGEMFDKLTLHCLYRCSAFIIRSKLSCLHSLIHFHRERQL